MPLAQGVAQGHGRGVGWSCGHFKAPLGLETPLPSSRTWLPADLVPRGVGVLVTGQLVTRERRERDGCHRLFITELRSDSASLLLLEAKGNSPQAGLGVTHACGRSARWGSF